MKNSFLSQFDKVSEILKGMSGDKKYRVEKGGQAYLLRSADITEYKRKKDEYDYLNHLNQASVDAFFEKCFTAVGIPYSLMDRHDDIADVEQYYIRNGCFWCLFDNGVLIGTVAIRIIDIESKVIEIKRMFVLPEYQGRSYGRLHLVHAINYAREQKYKKMYLDNRKQFSVAQHLYRSNGFKRTEKYNDNEHAELYFELVL